MIKKSGLETVFNALSEKKGEDIRIFDVDKISDFWEYYVLCTGTSAVHVNAININLEKKMKDAGFEIAHKDLKSGYKWIVIDFGDILVHVFDEETRNLYSIEKLWGEKEVKKRMFEKGI